jgi:transposase
MQAVPAIYTPAFIDATLHENRLLKIENEALKKQVESLSNEQLKLQLQLQKFALMVFGKKGERFIANPDQLALDMAVETLDSPSTKLGEAKKISFVKTNQPKKRILNELGAYMKDLPHVYETKEPDHIPEGAVKIGEDLHETLEHTPGKAFVKVVVIPKYKVPSTDSNKTLIIAAPAPERPLFKCLAGASLLALILTDKYCDHMPLYRQAKKFKRGGLALPYNSLIDLNARAIDLITPIFMILKRQVVASSYIHADETTIKVLFGKENQPGKAIHGGFLWCYHNSIDNLVFFDYQKGRGENCTEGILKDFKGFLQTDGWQVYKNIASKNNEITQLCCWAHARRKFVEACPYDRELAEFALKKIGLLYDIERQCKEKALSYDQIATLRREQALPVLNDLHSWMLQTYTSVLPSSHIATAIGYSIARWQELCHYVNDGRLKIDNNPVERSIRPVALGRKNFLFAGSHKGAERLAIIYSLTGT